MHHGSSYIDSSFDSLLESPIDSGVGMWLNNKVSSDERLTVSTSVPSLLAECLTTSGSPIV
eukprot:CAMPEP_0167752270 /NCGR_PEP_ID=MMETSP0110_2-20121227/7041_1 /TAXON_ID=629695 /ORGANISM="Gymnochlora sp., Strain CCMP2014" /LENGTH=60 /DNA_ID=CAMNT_0007637859 /DNA_START=386 /DNA_END=568 /DNA_ORIENTATION=-